MILGAVVFFLGFFSTGFALSMFLEKTWSLKPALVCSVVLVLGGYMMFTAQNGTVEKCERLGGTWIYNTCIDAKTIDL